MRNFILLVFFFFCFCTRQQTNIQNVVDLLEPVDEEITNLSEIAKDIDYIPLQTIDSSLISRINSIKVRGNFFYIKAIDKIYCFADNGKFLFKLDKKGRGPDEYEFINNFDLNFDNSILAVHSGLKVNLYNRTDNGFSFKNRISLRISPSSISFIDGSNNMLLMYSNQIGTNSISKELINIKGESLDNWPNFLMYSSKDNMVVYSAYENLSYYFNNNLFLKELQNDTLFSFTGEKKLEPYFVFNTRDKRLSPEARSNGLYYSEHMGEYIILQKVMESERYLYYSYSYNLTDHDNIYDKKSKVVYKVDSKIKFTDDLIGGVNFEPQYCNNGIFYSWIDPFNLKKELSGSDIKNVKNPEKYKSLLKLIDTLNENDNPILIIAKMK